MAKPVGLPAVLSVAEMKGKHGCAARPAPCEPYPFPGALARWVMPWLQWPECPLRNHARSLCHRSEVSKAEHVNELFYFETYLGREIQ